jgi:hypothetical protein
MFSSIVGHQVNAMHIQYPEVEATRETYRTLADYFSKILSEVETEHPQRGAKSQVIPTLPMPLVSAFSFAVKRK